MLCFKASLKDPGPQPAIGFCLMSSVALSHISILVDRPLIGILPDKESTLKLLNTMASRVKVKTHATINLTIRFMLIFNKPKAQLKE